MLLLGSAGFFAFGSITGSFTCTAGLSYASRSNVLLWFPLLITAAGLVIRCRTTNPGRTCDFPVTLWLVTVLLFTLGHLARQRHWIGFYHYYH
ncbi:MAG: hypothetical protein J6386_16830 [Candidatus Synoicihabitans palmerolidicus]|nr:hypothetical protein [Candidatus Synoicihabitans palmerolidicus]